jgi:hypothetical protein
VRQQPAGRIRGNVAKCIQTEFERLRHMLLREWC